MRLRLSKIHVVNWKCYKDQTIEFHQSSERNISVVFGNNGFGKTSLLEAIRWCLYGTDPSGISKNELSSRFNRVALRDNPSLSLSAELTFESDNHVIVVSRSAKRIANGSTARVEIDEATFTVDGIQLTNPREQVEALLPRACSEFYFFDGVEIKRYAQKVHSPEMRTAIERVLGIPELRNLREDAARALAEIDHELAVVESAKPELQRATERIQEQQEELEVLNEQIALAMSEHEAAQDILERLKSEANAQEILKSQLEEVDRKRRDIQRLKRDVDEADSAIEQAMRHVPISLLQGFVSEVAAELQRKSITSARRSGVSGTLRTVLETAMCICGRGLDEASRRYIEASIGPATDSESTRKAMIEESERNRLEILALFKPANFGELLSKRDRVANDLDGLEQELQKLEGENNFPSVSIAELWKKVGDGEANVSTRRESIAALRRDEQSLQAKIDIERRNREAFATRFAETAALGMQATLARRLLDASKDLIDDRIAETRFTIEEVTSSIHLAVTNKPDEYVGVEISPDDYSLRIRSASGELLDPDTLSAGEKEALAFSFIAGLNVASGKSAPFVMDTPFGHLDVAHQRNLVTALPRLPAQVTLLATDRDLPAPLLEEISDHIADTMTITRVGATDDASVIRGD